MTDFHHRCQDNDCIYVGQRTSPNMCKCHKSTDRMTHDALVKVLVAAQRIIERDFPNGQLAIDIRRILDLVRSPPTQAAIEAIEATQ